MTDDAWLDNSHYQSYLVLNLSRILYTVMCGMIGSKKVSAQWVKSKYQSVWINHLLEVSESWNYNKKMLLKNEAVDFIKFTIDEIKKTPLFHEMYS